MPCLALFPRWFDQPAAQAGPSASGAKPRRVAAHLHNDGHGLAPAGVFAARFIGTILTPFYYATPENDWHTLIQPHIADWLQPRDLAVMWPFYEGLEQGQSIPWAGWLPMFLHWAPLVWALFLAMIAVMAILRKQWNDYERLTYPLVQVPMALTEQDAGGTALPHSSKIR